MSAVVGKIGFLLSKLLDAKEMEELLSSGSVPEIADKLRKTAYGKFVPNIEDIHRRDLEAAIQRRYQSELESLEKYFTFPEKSILKHIMMRCEIETVKKVLRILTAGDEIEERFLICFPDGKRYSNVQDFISSLKGKPYYGILSSVHGAGGNLAKMENSLDYWYFSHLLRKLRLSRRAGRIIKLFKDQVDLTNIMWIYRAKILFGYEKERVMNLLLPFGRRFKMNQLEDLASSKSPDELVSKLKGTPYYEYFESSLKSLGEFLIERYIDRYLHRKFLAFVKNYMNDFEMMIGYIHLLEYELKNIVTIIEAVRYDMNRETAKEYLVI